MRGYWKRISWRKHDFGMCGLPRMWVWKDLEKRKRLAQKSRQTRKEHSKTSKAYQRENGEYGGIIKHIRNNRPILSSTCENTPRLACSLLFISLIEIYKRNEESVGLPKTRLSRRAFQNKRERERERVHSHDYVLTPATLPQWAGMMRKGEKVGKKNREKKEKKESTRWGISGIYEKK